jgi:peptide chain release factor 1
VIDRLENIARRFRAVMEDMALPEVASDPERFTELAREQRELEPIVRGYEDYRALERQIRDDEEVINSGDDELAELAREELPGLREKLRELESELKYMLVPADPNDKRNAVMEIRAGTGGEEATLFAGDLYRMYTRFFERVGFRSEALSSSPSEIGGFKEIIFLVSGEGAYGTLKYEGGVHRVQRVPVTESSGRLHTSAASVAVLPEAEEVDIEIDPKDLRIDVFRSSGHGGQHVNTTDSAVRITHIPTGIVATCQDEKSQHKNKAKAMKVLQARVLQKARRESEEKTVATRRNLVGSGDRSEKIRTYNFPQNRLTDHRINLTLYRLDQLLDGYLSELIEALQTADKQERLEEVSF